MKTKVKDGNLNIKLNLVDILSQLDTDSLNEVIESLSCDSKVIKNVSDQIIHGFTEMGWHGSKGFNAEPSTALDKAVREIAESSSDIAKKEIKDLKRMVKLKEETNKELWERIHKLEDENDRIRS